MDGSPPYEFRTRTRGYVLTTETIATDRLDPADLASLVTAVQSRGLRVEVPIGARRGGAGPADAGMLYIDGRADHRADNAGYVAGLAVRPARRGRRQLGHLPRAPTAGRSPPSPRGRAYYDLTTADGIPYWQIALLHLDSVASTVLQTCAYWGNADQCTFCGIGVSLAAGRTIAKKTPAMLAEVAVAARDLDGAVDATLTTGQHRDPRPRRALRRAVRPGGQGGLRAAGAGAVRAAARPRRDRPGRRHGRRLGRHPRRDLRPAGAGPGGARQGALGHRGLLRGLGARGRGVRRRARCRPT